MNVKKIWEKITNSFGSMSNGHKVLSVVLVAAVGALGSFVGIDRVWMSDEPERTDAAIIAAVPDLQAQWQSDFTTYYIGTISPLILAAQDRADAAWDYADNVSRDFNGFYTDEYLTYLKGHAGVHEEIMKLFESFSDNQELLMQLCQMTGPLLDCTVVSGMVCPTGETVMDGVIQLTIKNPLAVPFNDRTFMLILVGDGFYQGLPNVNWLSDSVHFSIVGDMADINGNSIFFESGITDVPGNTTITVNLTFHIVFEFPVEETITFGTLFDLL